MVVQTRAPARHPGTAPIGPVESQGQPGAESRSPGRGAAVKRVSARVVAAAMTAALATFLVHAFRLSAGPDVNVDETVYYLVSRSLAQGEGMAFRPIPGNDPFFWQPPLFFLVEALWLRLTGNPEGGLFQQLYHARWVNVAAGAVTAGMLVALGARLIRLRAGVIMAVLYALDPWVLRANRRNMLETLAGVWILASVILLVEYDRRQRRRWLVAAGVAFGLALLTKEITFFVLLIPFALALLRRSRRWLIDGSFAAVVALGVYAVYPLWALASGDGASYMGYKSYQLNRFRGAIQTTGWNRSGAPGFAEALSANIDLYASSYALVAIAAIALPALWLYLRDRPGARLVIALGAVTYLNFAFIIAQGQLNDQFFYLLLVPVTVVVGYVLSMLGELRGPSKGKLVRAGGVALAVLVMAVSLNAARLYIQNYALGSDDAYFRTHQYLASRLQPGEKVVVDSEASNYFYADYATTRRRDAEQLVAEGYHYFVFSDKLLWGRFDRLTPAYREWLAAHGQEVFSATGNTYWTIHVFYVP